MEFRTEQANRAYQESILKLTTAVADMYGQLNDMAKNISPIESFQIRLSIESFRMDANLKAIQIASGIDHDHFLLQGQIAAAVTLIGRD